MVRNVSSVLLMVRYVRIYVNSRVGVLLQIGVNIFTLITFVVVLSILNVSQNSVLSRALLYLFN